jgi:hypothetical protein
MVTVPDGFVSCPTAAIEKGQSNVAPTAKFVIHSRRVCTVIGRIPPTYYTRSRNYDTAVRSDR